MHSKYLPDADSQQVSPAEKHAPEHMGHRVAGMGRAPPPVVPAMKTTIFVRTVPSAAAAAAAAALHEAI